MRAKKNPASRQGVLRGFLAGNVFGRQSSRVGCSGQALIGQDVTDISQIELAGAFVDGIDADVFVVVAPSWMQVTAIVLAKV